MPEASLLETTAEVAVAFAGFTGIFLILAPRDGGFSAADALSIRVIVLGSVAPVFYAVIPLLLHSVGISGTTLWRVSSSAVGTAVAGLTASIIPYMSAVPVADRPKPLDARNVVPWLLTAAALGINVFNALGWPWSPSGGAYLFGVWSVVAIAGLNFVVLLFRRVL